ncbi:hypothetical protein M3Y99_00057100 [Aphelenchoides fujianensis]|nr:hypothetical protein M3Y99_00057100 [Aphelenchoides fujianensis]
MSEFERTEIVAAQLEEGGETTTIVHEHVELSKSVHELGDLTVAVDVTKIQTTVVDSGYNETGDTLEQEAPHHPPAAHQEDVVEEDDLRSSGRDESPVPQPMQRTPEFSQPPEARKEVEEQKSPRSEDEQRENEPAKKVRPLLQRDFTQQSVDRKPEQDQNDWAKKNLGTGRINDLIARFNKGAVLNDNENVKNGEYKSAYGVGQGKGSIQQSVFR